LDIGLQFFMGNKNRLIRIFKTDSFSRIY